MDEQPQTAGRIIQLTAENVKRLKVVRIEPDGSPLVIIAGQNGQGKSSVLDAMEMALNGGKAIPEQPLRIGERKGYVIVDLGGLVVKRTFRANGSSALEVRDSDNRIVNRPQKVLDDLLGSLTFDPMAFMSMKPADQADELRRMVGLDLSEFENRRQEAFEHRTELNRKGARLVSAMNNLAESDADPDAIAQSVVDLMGVNSALTAARDAANRLRGNISEARRQLLDDAKKIEDLRKRHEDRSESMRIMCKNLESLPDPSQEEIDVSIKAIETCEETNRNISLAMERRTLGESIDTTHSASEILTNKINRIDQERREAISKADMPIDGLSFDQDGSVTYGSVALQQASTSEQIRVSMAIGLAGHGELNIMSIKHGNDLDRDSLALVAQLAEEAGAQVWIERIDSTGTPWVIEDGEIDGAREDPDAYPGVTLPKRLEESGGSRVSGSVIPGTPEEETD